MRNDVQVALLDGDEGLEVVGESFHQPDLSWLTILGSGPKRRCDLHVLGW
jgi:hypothetical protein